MARTSWWFGVDALPSLHHLGWYGGPDKPDRRKPEWLTPAGLDPDRLIWSDLFHSDAVERVEEVHSIPAASSENEEQLSGYLRRDGWAWSPRPPSLTGSPAVIARTASKVAFWIDPTGLKVEFEDSDLVDLRTGRWAPRWPGFFLVNLLTLDEYGEAMGLPRCSAVLKYIVENVPWLAEEARVAMDETDRRQEEARHRMVVQKQEKLKEMARSRRITLGDR